MSTAGTATADDVPTMTTTPTLPEERLPPAGDARRARWVRWATWLPPAFAIALALVITRHGPGTSPDSRAYLMSAEHLARGLGYTILSGDGDPQPLTHFPPLYALLLAPADALGGSVAAWARVLNACLFGVTVALVGRLVRRCGGSALLAVLCMAITALSPDLLLLHTFVLSEPTFLACLLGAVLLLDTYLRAAAGKRGYLAGAGLLLAAALGARFSTPPFILAAGLCVLLNPRRRLAHRTLDLVLLGTLACLPMAGWMVRSALLTGNAANRPIVFHPPSGDDLEVAVVTLASWLIPKSGDTFTWLAFAVALTLAVVTVAWAWRRGPVETEPAPARRVLATAAVCYVLFLLFSVTFVDAHTPLDDRILAPVHVALIVLVAVWVERRPLPHRLAARLGTVFLIVLACRGLTWAYEAPELQLGYGSRRWRESEVARYVAQLPPDALIYTNAQDFLYLGPRRFGRMVPGPMDPVTRRADKQYHRKLSIMRREMASENGYLVYFSVIRRKAVATEQQLLDALPLRKVFEAPEGNVYQLEPEPPAKTVPAPSTAPAPRRRPRGR